MQLALKVNVETYRGTLQGVPRLVDILRRHQANATFCFALGPDQTGRMPKRDGSSVAKTGETISRLKRYGFKSLMFGNPLPGPDIGKRCVSILTGTASAGFETAIHGWNVARWQAGVDRADGVWTEIEMRRAHERYAEIFGVDAHGHAAPGWQMNPHALRLTQRLGYQWASDCRGTHPFIPVWNAEIVRCPQLPTTLPALAELVGFDNVSAENAHMALLQRTANKPETGHVLTLHAELEGLRFSDSFELLLTGLREQGYELVSLGQMRATLNINELPRHEVSVGTPAGCAWPMLVQGDEFLAQWKDAA